MSEAHDGSFTGVFSSHTGMNKWSPVVGHLKGVSVSKGNREIDTKWRVYCCSASIFLVSLFHSILATETSTSKPVIGGLKSVIGSLTVQRLRTSREGVGIILHNFIALTRNKGNLGEKTTLLCPALNTLIKTSQWFIKVRSDTKQSCGVNIHANKDLRLAISVERFSFPIDPMLVSWNVLLKSPTDKIIKIK